MRKGIKGVERKGQPVASGTNPLGLRHPALTPMPAELRPRAHAASSTTGRRVVGGRRSGYVTPLEARAARQGALVDLRERLEAVRVSVDAGETLLEAVADGTLWGWRAREVLSHVVGEPLANWDRETGRTQRERLAVVIRALGELSAEPRRGGWSVSSGGGR